MDWVGGEQHRSRHSINQSQPTELFSFDHQHALDSIDQSPRVLRLSIEVESKAVQRVFMRISHIKSRLHPLSIDTQLHRFDVWMDPCDRGRLGRVQSEVVKVRSWLAGRCQDKSS